MDSNKYNEIIMNNIEKNCEKSTYYKTVSRQFSIYTSIKKKKIQATVKLSKILLDYSIYTDILWNKGTKGIVSFNKKEDSFSLPEKNLAGNMEGLLTDIPFFLAKAFHHKLTSSQKIIDIEFLDWLQFFTFKFFEVEINFGNKYNIVKLEDTLFYEEIFQNEDYQDIDENNITHEENDSGSIFLHEQNESSILYMKNQQRHLLYNLNLN